MSKPTQAASGADVLARLRDWRDREVLRDGWGTGRELNLSVAIAKVEQVLAELEEAAADLKQAERRAEAGEQRG